MPSVVKKLVDILMATYNGEKYIEAQITSLLKQNYKNWHLWIQDDGSKDRTVEIIQDFSSQNPNRITLVKENPHPKGAAGNFYSLLPFTKGEYVFFCDQDDVWHPNKITDTLAVFHQEENSHLPLLVHTDLQVVDESLKEMAPSFMAYQNLHQKAASLGQILCQNNITGCTMAVNRALIKILWQGEVPSQGMLMHDWWLGIGAAAYGKICYLPKATMYYRQHGGNEVGAKKSELFKSITKAFSHKNETKKKVENTYLQAQSFYQAYQNTLPKETGAVIKKYGGFLQKSKGGKIKNIIFGPYKKQGFARVIGQIVFC